jgi:hypothetical protein
MADEQSPSNERGPAGAVVIKKCEDLSIALERAGRRVFIAMIFNVGVVVMCAIYVTLALAGGSEIPFELSRYLNIVMGSSLAVSVVMLIILVYALVRFRRISRNANIYVEEISDLLGWYRENERPAVATEVKIAIRQLAVQSELPLASGDDVRYARLELRKSRYIRIVIQVYDQTKEEHERCHKDRIEIQLRHLAAEDLDELRRDWDKAHRMLGDLRRHYESAFGDFPREKVLF